MNQAFDSFFKEGQAQNTTLFLGFLNQNFLKKSLFLFQRHYFDVSFICITILLTIHSLEQSFGTWIYL